jgi:hypothetical protein
MRIPITQVERLRPTEVRLLLPKPYEILTALNYGNEFRFLRKIF